MLNRYKLFFIIWTALLVTGCRKDSSDSGLENGYLGTLSLEYSKSFPSLVNASVVDIEISKSGEVTITNPMAVTYKADDEVSETVKIREEGTINVGSLTGKVNTENDERLIEITGQTRITGISTSWGWDDELGWVFSQAVPFNLNYPVKNSMVFKISEASITGDEISETISGNMGDAAVTWTLLLVPKLTR